MQSNAIHLQPIQPIQYNAMQCVVSGSLTEKPANLVCPCFVLGWLYLVGVLPDLSPKHSITSCHTCCRWWLGSVFQNCPTKLCKTRAAQRQVTSPEVILSLSSSHCSTGGCDTVVDSTCCNSCSSGCNVRSPDSIALVHLFFPDALRRMYHGKTSRLLIS